jgi:hypothetical protein
MKKTLLLISTFISFSFFQCTCYEQITPYKFTDTEKNSGSPRYEIPSSSRFTIPRSETNSSDIVYYLSKPQSDSFPIAIVCTGSSHKHTISSVIHVHRFFLQEFLDLEIAVLTAEQQGVDGQDVNVQKFMQNYTCSNRLSDHRQIIQHLKSNPIAGWNGKLIFLGISEGGRIVTTLTTDFSDMTLATMNFCGTGDYAWDEEVWIFLQHMITHGPWYIKFLAKTPTCILAYIGLSFAKSRQHYDQAIKQIITNPSADLYLAGMTYKYHADALQEYPKILYEKIKTPFLVVTGTNDSIITSSDAFVQKAQDADAPITYMRVSDMDHYVRKRADIIHEAFAWLEKQL